MTETSGFVPLLIPRDNTEFDLAKGLLEGAEVPFAIGASDRVKMLEIFAGASAEGLHVVLVPADRLQEAKVLFLEAWGATVFDPWVPEETAEASKIPEFVPLLVPRDNVEYELGKGLLEEAKIPVAMGASDRVQLLKVFAGSSATGLHVLLIPADRLEEAIALFEGAWGPEAFVGRDPRQ